MQGPGQSLRQAREAHGRTLEEMSEATGIRLPFLTALEQEAFDSLPGRGFGKLYIRAYAEVLGFDPRPLIEAYDRAVVTTDTADPTAEPTPAPRPVNAALARLRSELIARRAEADLSEEPEDETFDEPAPEPATLVETVETVAPPHPARPRRWLGAALILAVLLTPLAYFVFLRSTPDPPDTKVITPSPALPQPPQAVEGPRSSPRTQSPSGLEVAESGVGLRLVGTTLEGKGDRFVAGQRVTFATRVLGGAAGEHIRHVWLRDGRIEQSISLSLGGASWRTYSTKTLGRPGAWAVEARDDQGRVLARADLTVAP